MRHSAYIAACTSVAAMLCFRPGELLADKDYRVVITSDPPGANVWIDDRSGDPAGKTPYDGRLPEGKHTLFLELDGYEFAVQEITVRGRKAKQTFPFQLSALRYGSIDVLAASSSPGADGAKVLIDGKEVGTVPDTFEIPEGAHQLEVVKDGYQRFEKWVEISKGNSLEVSVALAPLKAGGATSTKTRSTATTEITTTAPPPEPSGKEGGPAPLVLEAGLGSGWRRFAYEQPRTNNLRPYSADGIALVDLGAEFRLGTLVSSLKAVSIFGGASLSLPLTSNTAAGNEQITTTWFRREVGVRGRVALGPAGLGVDVAEGGNSFTFGNAGLLAGEIPDAVYEYVRVGAGLDVTTADMAFGAGADGLFVLTSKGVSERFADAAITGLRVHGFVRRRMLSSIDAALSGSFTQFSYTLEPAADYDADGSYDRMIDVILSAAYRF